MSFSSASDQFIADYEKFFTDSKNQLAIDVVGEFKTHFDSDFSSGDKTSFITLSQTMLKRGHTLPEFYQLSLLLNQSYGDDFPSKSRSALIEYLNKLAANQPKAKVNGIYIQLNNFLGQRKVYNDKVNTLYALNGTYDFRFFDQAKDYFEKDIPAKESPKEDIGLFDDYDKDAETDLWDSPSLNVASNGKTALLDIPRIEGLVLVLNAVDLVMVSPSDSFPIQQTSAAVDLFNKKLVGQGGTVNWSLAEVPEARAELDLYSFKTDVPYIKAENVHFEYPKVLAKPIEGVFEFRGSNRPKGTSITYPRFKSYENTASFKPLASDIEYLGGFSLIGNRVFSTSLFHNVSSVYVNRGHSNSFKVEGRKIEFTDSLITSNQVSFTSYIKGDSIYHPAVELRYNIQKKLVNLYKVKRGGFRNSMYSNTFHKVDIKSDAMHWDLNSGQMDFYIIAGKTEVPAIFQSFNYYNPAHLRELSTVAGWNPLIFLGNYLFKKHENRFDIPEIEDKVKRNPDQIRNGILLATQMGFLDHEPRTDTYSLSRKGIHYFKSAMGFEDYDDLIFNSYAREGANNATIDRNSNTLDIEGTSEFKLSDSLGIRFLPKDQSMKMEGSKSIKFDGLIIVKNYNFYGDFEVDYENFLVHLLRIDSITFTPLAIWLKDKKSKLKIGGHVAYGKTGTLYLNAPDNKSGRKSLPQYPRLVVPDGALVRFDDPSRRNFTYPEDVYFKLDPIDQDSLNSAPLARKGKFFAQGIVPDIQETLLVMPDSSLGFVHKAPRPYPLYGLDSKMTFTSPLEMTKNGLISAGTLQHLAAQTQVEKIKFGAKEAIFNGPSAEIQEITLNKEAYFPAVKIDSYKAKWVPEADSLIIHSDETFSFYEASTLLSGELVVREQGLFGQGHLERQDSEADSKAIKFNKTGFLASESNFKIKSKAENTKPILDGQRLKIDFNVEKQLVSLSPEEESFNDTLKASITFPYAAYKTTIDNATWHISEQKINMKGNVENSVFSSTAPSQYGLAFNGETAEYNIADNTLNIGGVPGIPTVDALVVPNDGKVAVREQKLLPFTNAMVIADTLNKYHQLTKANITVNSKLSYSGDASYRFVNVSADTFNIKMGSFEFAEVSPEGEILKSKKSGKLSTIARAKVVEADSLFLSPKMLYIGDMIMLAPFKNLRLNGQVTPVLNNYPVLSKNYINYSGDKSEEISIDVDETLKDGGKPLYAGLHLNSSATSESLYPTFLSAKRRAEDSDIFLSRGLFKRDEANKRFVITPTEEKSKSGGNSYELYDEEGLIVVNGRFNLLQPHIAQYMETVGQATVSLDSLEYNFNTFIKYNFPVPMPILAKMSDNVVKTNLDVGNSDPAIVVDDTLFMSKISQFIGTKNAEEYRTAYYKKPIPLFQQSPVFYGTVIFSELNLRWNPVYNAFYSVGPIGIANIGETDINAKVPGYFEIKKDPNKGDFVSFFLELSPNTWYYFSYNSEQLGISSSDFEFNKMLGEKEKSSAKGVELIASDMAEAMKFRKRFLISYLGVSPEEFEKPVQAIPAAVPGKVAPVQVPQVSGQPTTPAVKKKKEEDTQDGF
ncbi:hypothetical protein LAG90_15015 [Marinilongibacter aquaticus]|uniref:hypothetical protein n=1 Tax=Marinilongibacter aquaticus TaxID=2975157 RepID=UPI0021BD39EA|nr:hypothetical protein [Marinilongibacter aquaticus]UBM58115.1 hypothetical protein LAG90_15015 [Marinilongibacter aquaticus]